MATIDETAEPFEVQSVTDERIRLDEGGWPVWTLDAE
jgi:hypothetical protein